VIKLTFVDCNGNEINMLEINGVDKFQVLIWWIKY